MSVYKTSFMKPDGTIVELAFDALGRVFANGIQIGHTHKEMHEQFA